MIREADAKTKWCPFARQPSTYVTEPDGTMYGDGPAVNRWKSDEKSLLARCIGSECMAWQSPNGTFGYCGLVSVQEHARCRLA